ncbi:MAG: 3-oxoacyl-ACP synthase [Actinomycetota bacterium]
MSEGLAPVGLVDVARYEPERFMTADELGELAGIPGDVVREKFGLEGKRIAAPDEHVSDMCIAAARPLLERHDGAEIDAVVYVGSHWKDHAVWQAAPRVQHALGIEGFSLEAVNVSAGAPVGVKIVRDLLAADDRLRSVLLVGASKESHLLDYANPRARFMFTFGDGAAAAILRRGHTENEVLGSSLYTDGAFSPFVRVPAGGSVHPASHETVDARMHFLDVSDPAAMKEGLDPVTIKNFVSVARDALERSGLGPEDLDVLLPIHMKPSIHRTLLTELGCERSIYLDRNGHMSAVDPLFSLALARDRGLLTSGDVVMLLAAGTGYTWAASVLRWGPAPR